MKGIKAYLIAAANESPMELREAFLDRAVVNALEGVGIRGQGGWGFMLGELHAAGAGARKQTGAGVTLCGQAKGARVQDPQNVTCKRCRKKQGTST